MSRRVAKSESAGGSLEDFPTPSWCVDRLLDEIYLPNGCWLEPCAGEGSIIQAVNDRIGDATWTAVDIDPKHAGSMSHLIARGAIGDYAIEDFLTWAEARIPPGKGWPYDVVITNPPFSRANEFIATCRKLAPYVVMLLRLNYLESAKRAEEHRRLLPSEIWVLPDRPCFQGGKSDSCAYGWFVWTPQSGPESRLRVLRTTPKSERRPNHSHSSVESEAT